MGSTTLTQKPVANQFKTIHFTAKLFNNKHLKLSFGKIQEVMF